MKKVLFLVSIVLCFVVSANAGQKYTSEEHNISIEFPDSWNVSGGHAEGTIAKAVHRDELGRVAMVTVGVTEMENENEYFSYLSADPMKIAQMAIQQYPTIKVKLIHAKKTTIDNSFAIEIKYILKLTNSDRVITMFMIPRQYNLITISVGIDKSIYDKDEHIVQEVISSVDLLEKDLKMIPR